MPSALASSASIERAGNTSSVAFCRPTMRGNRKKPPASGTRPMRPNTWQNRARGVARAKSAASAMLNPAPQAGPSTAAITGSSRLTSSCGQTWMFWMRRRLLPGSDFSAMPLRSPPAQKAARAGDDRRLQRVVVAHLHHHIGQLLAHRNVERVLLFRTVQGDDRDIAANFVGQSIEFYRMLSRFFEIASSKPSRRRPNFRRWRPSS